MDVSNWSDERTALAVSVSAVVVVSIAGSVYELPFLARNALAVAAGVLALVLTSYALTGRLTPPDDDT